MTIRVEQFEAELKGLTPTSNNPRQINKKDFEALKKSLKEFPEMKTIREVVIDEDNRILGGHMRVKALLELGEKTVWVKQVFGLTEEQKNEFVIKDNIANGEWDMDILANEWSDLPLDEWGLGEFKDFGDIIDEASKGSVEEYSDDINYNISKLYREKANSEIVDAIKQGVSDGEIRGEIEEVLMDRARQCAIFNFDEIIKFYRSGDASETEKELLKRLYLVFITPKEAVENGILRISEITGRIYDEELTEVANV